MRRIVMVEMATMLAPQSTTLTARRTVSEGMRRSYATMSWFPRASANAARNRIARVVTLMPPAVEADPPPTNISMSNTSRVAPPISEVSTVLNPPERDIIETNNAVIGR